jgi:hypothetical protein
MVEDNRRFKSTEEMALSRIGGELPSSLPQDRYGTVEGEQRKLLQRQIDDAMKGAIEDAFHRPNPITGGPPSATVRVSGAAPVVGARGTGWRKEVPIETPGGKTAMAAIDALADSYQPHGVGNKEPREPKKE